MIFPSSMRRVLRFQRHPPTRMRAMTPKVTGRAMVRVLPLGALLGAVGSRGGLETTTGSGMDLLL